MIASLEIRLDCEATPGQAMRQAFAAWEFLVFELTQATALYYESRALETRIPKRATKRKEQRS